MNKRAWSNSIKLADARNLIDAARFAARTRPLNRFVTISQIDSAADRPQSFVSAWLKYFGDWLRHHDTAPKHAIWVLERTECNIHTHILLHVPANAQRYFKCRLRPWLRSCDMVWEPKSIASKRIDNLTGLLAYILKGIDPACEELVAELQIRPRPQGPINGKRCGVSQAIGPSARRKCPLPPALLAA